MKIPELIKKETEYQQRQLKLIPSENYVSPAVMQAVGSTLMNKYAEGQVGKRYYQGNKYIDELEAECKRLALELFHIGKNGWHVNVQTVTGGVANFALYSAILQPGDKVLSMDLASGGHISHGWKLSNGKPVSFASRIFDTYFYKVSDKNGLLDHEEIRRMAVEIKPKMIISGGTAYPRVIDFKKLAEIAHDVGAYYHADVAHEAGLIAGGVYPSPFGHADFVTMTTRKTLRGPIGALIFCHNEFAEQIDRAVFPGIQGGPMMNSIAGIAVALQEASTEQFNRYAQQIITNARTLAQELTKLGLKLITGGTDTHLMIADVREFQSDGLVAAELLEQADIIVNKSTIPSAENQTPWRPAGIRLGTPAITTRGMKENEMKMIASMIVNTLNGKPTDSIKKQVHALTDNFPI